MGRWAYLPRRVDLSLTPIANTFRVPDCTLRLYGKIARVSLKLGQRGSGNGLATQSQRLEYNHVPFRGRRQGSRMFSSQWTFRLGWPLGRVLLELKAVMAVNERN